MKCRRRGHIDELEIPETEMVVDSAGYHASGEEAYEEVAGADDCR